MTLSFFVCTLTAVDVNDRDAAPFTGQPVWVSVNTGDVARKGDLGAINLQQGAIALWIHQ